MPTAVKMYVRLDHPLSPAEVESLREEFMQAMTLTLEDFYYTGPIVIVSAEDRPYVPVKDETSCWLDVNLWRSYFGPGYERGNAELFVRVAEWLEQRWPGAEIFYGHDVNDENVSRFDDAMRKELLELYRSSNR